MEHVDITDNERHLNESELHLNKSGTTELTKNVSEFFYCNRIDITRIILVIYIYISLGNEKVSAFLGVSSSILSGGKSIRSLL